jgi:hypothetical protein
LYAADGENLGGADAASFLAPLLIHDVQAVEKVKMIAKHLQTACSFW